jgi:hypothetical protein
VIYLSGPMTGLPDFNRSAFAAAADALRGAGYDVIVPHELKLDVDKEWDYYLRNDLIAMLTHCKAIALLPGWQASKGANFELTIAITLGFAVYEVIDNQLTGPDNVPIPSLNGVDLLLNSYR